MSEAIEALSEPISYKPGLSLAQDLTYDGFAELDQRYSELLPLARGDLDRYGQFAIANAVILKPPASIKKGYVLTNPSQIEIVEQLVGGKSVEQEFAYFRHEPASLHLGHTEALPFFIREDRQGKPYLDEFDDAVTLPGEDPRITRGVRVKGLLGKIHEGWLVSTTVATPEPSNPAYVQGIKQVFYWGESLSSMEPVAELNDTKNTSLYPVSADYEDTTLDVFARPKPHTSYLRLPDITALTTEAIDSEGIIITEDFLPKGVHGGPNFVKGAGPGHRELDIHEAVVETLSDRRWILHYRLGRYGYELPSASLPNGRLMPLGVIATRSQFPDAPAKPPENGIADYWDVLYGSTGHVKRTVAIGSRAGRMLVGASDSRVGVADVIRTA